ncbi:MAG: tRNA epoxyqueuosine(34) reductase QueG [Candidatus Cohnella colombiensis]|uniref:tRNA epoxyqueuosine(34) reductase QueG n=1 Tax=Candidatus Cohnella colombiensis TaxID=3121368 RepID=A0AA95EV04_9BACL|nr:MAG: tRNA epoxyqueuosine(34) reductase QueG [Cohnella sp.]
MSTIATTTSQFWRQFKEELIAAAPSMGIDKLGITSAEPFVELKRQLQSHRELGYESGFEDPDLDKRTDPRLSMPEAQSIISIAVAYPSKLKDAPVSEPGRRRGILSRSAWGEDYHVALRRRMDKLEAWIKERFPDAKLMSMIDTGALADRAVAERAGIGWSGKNCSVITPELGSWVYLGEMLTELPLPPDEQIADGCGDCTRCIDACPTGALVGPGQLNSQRCISYITQTKGFVEEELMMKIGNRLYGCDTCQIVCPVNRGIDIRIHDELAADPEVVKPLLRPLLQLGNRDFKAQFGNSSAAWRGRKPIQRNALIGLGNFKDAGSIPDIAVVLKGDPRPVLRGTAAWALGRIGDQSAMVELEAALETELELEVQEAIVRAISQLNKVHNKTEHQ